MNSLNNSRLAQYARYDLTVNGKKYRSFALLFIAVAAAVTLISLFQYHLRIQEFKEMGFYGSLMSDGIADTITSLGLFYFLVAASYINISLREKQSRIRMLTIPASNAVKFVWHAGLCFFGSIAVIIAAMVAGEVLNFTIGSLLLGTEHIGSFLVRSFSDLGHVLSCVEDSVELAVVILSFGVGIFTYSFITLVCTYRWRNGLLWSVLIMIAIAVLVMIIIPTLFTSESFVNFMRGIFGSMDKKAAENLILWSLTAIQWLLIALMWRGSYRRFTRLCLIDKFNKR